MIFFLIYLVYYITYTSLYHYILIMAALSSAALFSPEYVLTLDEINTVINAANMGPFSNHLSILPSLNISHIRMEYNNISNEPNMTVHMVSSRVMFKIYFCKVNNQVFQITTDHLTQRIYLVELLDLVELLANPNMF